VTPLADRLTRLPLRFAMRSLRGLQRIRWFFTRPRTRGAHAVAITAEGAIILVRLRYVGGWRLPGGGIEPAEEPAAAVIRELREEIGLTSYGAVHLVGTYEQVIQFRRDRSTLFLVTEVTYAPSWSWEVEAITESRPDALPRALSSRARAWIEAALPLLPG